MHTKIITSNNTGEKLRNTSHPASNVASRPTDQTVALIDQNDAVRSSDQIHSHGASWPTEAQSSWRKDTRWLLDSLGYLWYKRPVLR